MSVANNRTGRVARYSAASPEKVGRRHCVTADQIRALDPYDADYHVFSMKYSPGRFARFYIDGVLTADYGADHATATPLMMSLTNFLLKDGLAGIRGDGGSNLRIKWVKVWRKI